MPASGKQNPFVSRSGFGQGQSFGNRVYAARYFGWASDIFYCYWPHTAENIFKKKFIIRTGCNDFYDEK